MNDIRHGAGGGDEATSKGHFVKRVVGRRAKTQNELNTGEHELVAKRGATYGVFFSLFGMEEGEKKKGRNESEGRNVVECDSGSRRYGGGVRRWSLAGCAS